MVILHFNYPPSSSLNDAMIHNIQRTRALSHKKQKILSSSIKIENAAIVKKARLSKLLPKPYNHTIGDVNNIDYTSRVLLGTDAISINSSPSRQK